MSKIIFITGATGFLGSHIAQRVKQGHQIVALVRKSSDLWRCNPIKEKIILLYTDENDWQQKLIDLSPTVFIHCAWIGVTASERHDIQLQNENLKLANTLLSLTKSLHLEKFICLGSQAEYGFINECVDETFPAKPNTAYGMVKLKGAISSKTLRRTVNTMDLAKSLFNIWPTRKRKLAYSFIDKKNENK